MPLPKSTEGKSTESTQPGKGGQPPAKSGRQPWKKKTPLDVMSDQAEKLKTEIAKAEEDLKQKRKQLERVEQAKKLFEST